MFQLAMAHTSPKIVKVVRSPTTPNYNQPVTITAQVKIEKFKIKYTIIRYWINDEIWVVAPMSLDVEWKEDDYCYANYVREIPALPDNTQVTYKVYVSDIHGNSDVSDLFSYLVNDFVPPVISNVQQFPSSPMHSEAVTISAIVTEPPQASGVKNVIVGYEINHTWFFLDMEMQDGLWTSTIPGQSGGIKVNYFIEAFDNKGNSAKTTIFDYIVTALNCPPVADFTESASTIYTGETIDFDASGSHDPDGTIVTYHWDFGDGNTGEGVTVSHTYVDDGSYNVTLTVSDNEGATDSADATKVVLNRQPLASFAESAETVYVGETISFDASESSDPDGTVISYFWEFGDGTTGDGLIVQHAYSQNGTYTVTLTVTDDDGTINTASALKTVLVEIVPNQKPVASFTESAETVYAGEEITFNAAESYDPDGTIVSYRWNFGDRTTSTVINVSHSYSESGTYTVTLTVTDDDGATDTASATKTVLTKPVSNQKPVATFTESAKIVYISEPIFFDASGSSDPDGSIISYYWDFGDDTTGTGVSVQHTYSQTGTYIVTLKVTDDDGAIDTASAAKAVLNRTETVQNQSPTAYFTESAETVSSGENIHFDASESHDPDGIIINQLWDFGDGNTAVGVEVDHAYGDDGIYNVTLIVIDNNGATDSSTSTKTVRNRPPSAFFSENATTVRMGEAINFDASESFDPDGSIISYHWDFGDGNTTTGVASSHTYNEVGNYTVTLTVTDNDGTSSSVSAMKIVKTKETLDGVLSLSFLAAIGLGVTALTVTLLYGLLMRRKKRPTKSSET